jgi:hypothetical protein
MLYTIKYMLAPVREVCPAAWVAFEQGEPDIEPVQAVTVPEEADFEVSPLAQEGLIGAYALLLQVKVRGKIGEGRKTGFDAELHPASITVTDPANPPSATVHGELYPHTSHKNPDSEGRLVQGWFKSEAEVRSRDPLEILFLYKGYAFSRPRGGHKIRARSNWHS